MKKLLTKTEADLMKTASYLIGVAVTAVFGGVVLAGITIAVLRVFLGE